MKEDIKDFVKYETAEALRDAGYPQEEIKGWIGLLRQYAKGTRQEVAIYLPSGGKGCGFYLRQKPGLKDAAITAPHLWDAVAWIREQHGIHVFLTYIPCSGWWTPYVADMHGNYNSFLAYPKGGRDYEEVYERAVRAAVDVIKERKG